MTSAAHLLGRAACGAAARLLPAEVRERYLDEWRADLAWAPQHEVLPYAVGVLARVLALRAALREDDAPGLPVLCRLHLHREIEVHDNPEDPQVVSRECCRCGRVRDAWFEPAGGPGDDLAWGLSQTIH
ncbi:hypothetical protein [Lapillicoccus jejuensis]|uniref:Uncharacterized protein n=1 Tax=Lapillicoccus jejuensis TaxID=402171 RepID=A0A542E050_9MICO|nr:hypothetical protein [Lapillicoccus jejuensis]TQJ08708.1 hypothetical protein FB458_1800 [Lapillicoccus jejuensis]